MRDVITQIFLLNDPVQGETNDTGKGDMGREDFDEKHSQEHFINVIPSDYVTTSEMCQVHARSLLNILPANAVNYSEIFRKFRNFLSPVIQSDGNIW